MGVLQRALLLKMLRLPQKMFVLLPSGAGDVAQRRRGPWLQPLRLLSAAERRHPAGLLHNAANRHFRT